LRRQIQILLAIRCCSDRFRQSLRDLQTSLIVLAGDGQIPGGAIASLSTARRYPGVYGSLVLMSGSFVFTSGGAPHEGGPVFDPVVEFVNDYRTKPARGGGPAVRQLRGRSSR
jgi:hypothetical protein